MKKALIAYPIVMLCLLYNFAGCTKNKDEFIETDLFAEAETFPVLVNIDSILRLETIAPIPFPKSGKYNCNIAKLYKEPVLYNNGSDKDVIVKVDKAPPPGKFYAWPMGLAIDVNNGSINVSASQGGYKYTVGYVKNGTKDTCLQDIIIAGASYKDSIYILGNNDTLAFPYFNANAASVSVCDASDDDDYHDPIRHGNDKCEFDGEDHHGKGGHAAAKHVKVRTISGAINLKRTLEEGALGSADPVNGQGLVVPVYYQLQDQGNKAIQKINVQLIYYKSKSDIPAALRDYIIRKQTSINTFSLLSPYGNPRPPLIVITRS